jgi:hypothetical protein
MQPRPEVIRVYLDESEDAASYVVAGLIGAEENWSGFSDDWNAVIEKHGLNGVALHMSALQGSNDEPWVSVRGNSARYASLMNDLADVVIAHKLAMFGVCALMDEYKALDAEGAKRWPRPYKLTFETAFFALEEACAPSDSGRIYVTVDQGPLLGWAKQAYVKLRKKSEYCTRYFADELGAGDHKKVPEICGADFIAYELRRAFFNFQARGQNALRPWFQKLAHNTLYLWWKVNFENVIEPQKIVPFKGTEGAVSEIFLYQDDPKL